MPIARARLYAAGLVGLALAAFLLGIGGLATCEPAPLPGDGWWSWGERWRHALSILAGAGSSRCFEQSASGRLMLQAAAAFPIAATLLVAAIALWETAGRGLRRRRYRRTGGHAVLAGDKGELAPLAAAVDRPVAFLATSPADAAALARLRPFAEIETVSKGERMRSALRRLGARRAGFVAAVTDSDIVNLDIAETIVSREADGGSQPAEVLVRLEQNAVRALSGDGLRRRARRGNVDLTVVSLSQNRIRHGARLAMPGRYRVLGQPRLHVALCGSGAMLEDIAISLSRQGFGLDEAVPLMSVLCTGRFDFHAAAVQRLRRATAAVTLDVHATDAADPAGLDRTIAAIALGDARLTAVHCTGDGDGEAAALAERWEQAFLRLGLPVPPIVVYGEMAAASRSGMIRATGEGGLIDAKARAAILDRRAVALHEAFLANQKAARGEAFGSEPAEAPWHDLSANIQDDNRNSADHIDYKLARAGWRAMASAGTSATLDATAIEAMAKVEHARWLAAKALDGWVHGPSRDNTALHHPSMVPYEALPESEKEKDRDVIRAIPPMLALGGERLQRDFRCGLLATDEPADLPSPMPLVAALKRWTAANPARHLVASVTLKSAAAIALAEALLEAGISVEVVENHPVHASLDRKRTRALQQRAAAIFAAADALLSTGGEPADAVIEAQCDAVVRLTNDTNRLEKGWVSGQGFAHAGWLA